MNTCWYIEYAATAAQTLNEAAMRIGSTDNQKGDELFILARLFEKACNSMPLSYPFIVEPGESPDFVFQIQEKSIGVEITRFQAEQHARATSIAIRKGIGGTPTPFNFDSKPRKNDEIEARMTRPPMGLVDEGSIDEQVTVYIAQLKKIIERKIKAIKPGAQSENWLVIEDWMHIDPIQLDEIIRRSKIFAPYLENNSPFKFIILMLHDEVICLKSPTCACR